MTLKRGAVATTARAKLTTVGRAVPRKVATLVVAAANGRDKIRILIVHRHTLAREGLCKLLEGEPDFAVVGAATDYTEAIRSVHELKPDVVLLEYSTQGSSGSDALRGAASICPAVRTILITDEMAKSDVVEAVQFGARGILGQDSPVRLLNKCIRNVFGGELWIAREAVVDIVQALSTPKIARGTEQTKFGLTARELEILTLLVKGYTNKDIARELLISGDTVKHHLTSIFDKTGMSQRLELAIFTLHHGLVSNPKHPDSESPHGCVDVVGGLEHGD